jgi:hypothetical protein
MANKDLDWRPDTSLPSGKGATKQRFQANDGKENLEIETAPWGSGDLKADGSEVVHVDGAKSGPDAFRKLDNVAKEYEEARDAFEELPSGRDGSNSGT